MDPVFLFCSDNCDDLVTVEILIDSIVSYRENHIPVMKRKILIETGWNVGIISLPTILLTFAFLQIGNTLLNFKASYPLHLNKYLNLIDLI